MGQVDDGSPADPVAGIEDGGDFGGESMAAEPQHRRSGGADKTDAYFTIGAITTIWAVMLTGFIPDAYDHYSKHEPAYPLSVHLHALAFVGWIVFLTLQIGLIRTGRAKLHRALGVGGVGLAVAMVALGWWAALDFEIIHFGKGDPPFLIIEIVEMLVFIGLVGAAIANRRNRDAHKRLMLLATIALSSAGFARWPFNPFPWTGASLTLYLRLFVGPLLLILAIGAFDLLTRRKLFPAYVAGATLVAASEIGSCLIYGLPAWKPVAVWLTGH